MINGSSYIVEIYQKINDVVVKYALLTAGKEDKVPKYFIFFEKILI